MICIEDSLQGLIPIQIKVVQPVSSANQVYADDNSNDDSNDFQHNMTMSASDWTMSNNGV